MANVKITELNAIANPASTDVLAIVDVTADITKKVTIADLLENAGDGNAAAPAFSFDSDTNTGVFLEAADKLGFSTNGTGRIYIDASGNVGIAKNNPTQTLDVNGTAAVSGALTQGGNNVVTVGDTGTVTSTMIANGTIVDADVSATAEIAVSKLANGTARQLLQTDAAGTGVEFTSNVDVPGTLDVTGVATFDSNVTVSGNLTVNGTTTTIDSETLVVEDKNIEMGAVTTPSDTTADGGGITLKGATDKTLTWVNSTNCWTFNQALNLTAGTQSAPALVFDADVNSGIFHPTADTIAASTAGSERVRITPNGYVLVGTNIEPSSGDAHAQNARFVIRGRIGNSADSGRINLQRGSAASNGSSIGSITFTDNGNNAYARIETLADAATGTNDYPGAIAFSTTPDGAASPVERLQITSDGKTNLGQSAGAVGSKLNIFNGSDNQNILGITGADESTEYAALGISPGNAVITGGGIGTTSTGIIFRTAEGGTEVERMRIRPTGLIGIGTSNPTSPLHVIGDTKTEGAFVSLPSSGSSEGGEIQLKNPDGSTNGAVIDISATDTFRIFQLNNNSLMQLGQLSGTGGQITLHTGGSERVRINSSGNVGVGVSNPATPLHVSAAGATPVVIESSNSQSLINFRNSSTSLFFMGASSNNWNVQSSGVERLSVTSSGNVGINNNSPFFKLDVDAQIRAGSNTGYGFLALGNHPSDAYRNWHIASEGNGFLSFFNGNDGSGTKHVTIGSNGNFGLGLSAPTSLLHLQKGTGAVINLGTGTTNSNSVQGFNFYGRFVSGTTPAAPGQLTSYIREERQGSNAQFDLTFGTATSSDATEKMRIRSNGRCGIGTTNPSSIVQIGDTANSDNFITFGKRVSASETNRPVIGQTSTTGSNNDLGICATSTGGSIRFYTGNGSGGFGAGSNEERFRVDGSGNAVLGGNSINPVSNNEVGIALRSAGNFLTNTLSTNAPHQFRRNTDGDLIRFHNNATSDVGAISVGPMSTFYSTSSDYRLKENVVELDGAIDRVKQLAPKRFNFIVDPNKTVDGFLAHEAQTVVPQAVSGTHNEVDEENNPVMQRIDQSKLVPLLTAALKEAIAKIETLEQRLTDAGL